MARKRTYRVTADASLHPVLQGDLAALRGGMLGAAEKHPLPSRFTVRPDADAPRILVADTQTGRTSLIGLCDYYGVRQLLHDLFGANPTDT
jgi:hypothetical protein